MRKKKITKRRRRRWRKFSEGPNVMGRNEMRNEITTTSRKWKNLNEKTEEKGKID